MIRLLSVMVVLMVTGCGAGPEVESLPLAVARAGLDLSAEARKAAVIDAATGVFQQRVKQPFLEGQGLTVRGLARAATRAPGKPGTPAELHASRYDASAGSAAKLELVNGKVIFTAVASAADASAAVLRDERERYVVAWEVEAAVTPDGELKDFVFRQLGVATRAD